MGDDWSSELEELTAKVGVASLAERLASSKGDVFRRMVVTTKEYAMFLLDAHGVISSWNMGAQRIKQYRAEEAVGEHFRLLYTREDREARRAEKNLRDALKYGQTKDVGWRMRKDGSRFWADVVITALFEDDGKLLGFGKVIRDLTEINNAEAYAREQDVMRRTEELKDQFLALISHELRTPLTTIQGFADLVEDGSAGPLTEVQSAYLNSIIKANNVLTKHINDLIEMTSIRAKTLQLDLGPMNIAEVVQGVVFVVQTQAREKHLWLSSHVNPETPDVVADAYRIGQTLVHLLDNAVKFTPDGGRVDIYASVNDVELRCEVKDTGKGISPDAIQTIYDEFSQADMSDTRAEGGLGIGLNLARAIVEAHGGKMGVSSTVGRGSTFWFTLPLNPVQPD